MDDFSVTKGAHNLKFGANFRRYDITDYVFSEFSPPLDPVRCMSRSTERSLQRCLTVPTSSLRTSRTAVAYPVALWGLGLYAQDEWRVSKNLKLTLALRAEHDSNPVCQLNCASLY